MIAVRSQAMKDMMGMPDGLLQKERDRRLKEEIPKEGYPNPWADPVFRDFLFDYDASREAVLAWDIYCKGGSQPVPSAHDSVGGLKEDKNSFVKGP